jgi:hypothetical protein
MKLNRKLEIVAQAVSSITTHSDEDAAVRAAALDRVIAMATEQKKVLDAEVKAGIEAALAPSEAAK